MITIKFEIENNIAKLTLNRPEVKNAINGTMLDELIDIFTHIDNNEINARLLLIRGEGESFCSGADLQWLKQTNEMEYSQVYDESIKLPILLELIKNCPIPVISIVQGYCIGGGSGIVLSSDIVFADSQSKFGFSEVAIGVVPAAIVDLLIEKAGQSKARELFLTGRRIKADEAERHGIVNYSLESTALEQKLSETISYILNAAPKAMATMKEMIRKYNAGDNFTKQYVAKVIAELRIGEEAKKGINHFLNKEKVKW